MSFRSLRHPHFLPSRRRGYAVWAHRGPSDGQNQEMESEQNRASDRRAVGERACPICGKPSLGSRCSACHRSENIATKSRSLDSIRNNLPDWARKSGSLEVSANAEQSSLPEQELEPPFEELRKELRRLRYGAIEVKVSENASIPKQASEVECFSDLTKEEAELNYGGETQNYFKLWKKSQLRNGKSCSDLYENAELSSLPEEVCASPLATKQELEPASGGEEARDDYGLSSSSDEMNDLDGDGTEVSIKKPSSVGEGVKDPSRERAPWYGQGLSGDVVTRKKKGKSAWICSSCGHTDGQWSGECKVCKCVGTVQRLSVGDSGGDKTNGSGGARSSAGSPDEELPMRLADVNCGADELEWRIPLPGSFGSEVARVLGGGLVPGSLVLVGGDPGVGKSTLLLQIAALIAQGQDNHGPGPVMYVSGEESLKQIGNRASRIKIETKELFVYSSTDIEDILRKTHSLSPRLLIVDSIQTVHLKNVTGSAGGISQVKECTLALLRYAKQTSVPVLLTGHVTKTGYIAGPRVLEHIVDAVLYLEGEKGTGTSHRFLRCMKNRFGSTDELGVFEMTQLGLQAVENPSEMYLTSQPLDSYVLAGLAVAVVMDGTRSFLIEIQALCKCSSNLLPSSSFNGIQAGRAAMIISVLSMQVGLDLQKSDIFVNVVSGLKLSETAADLAIAVALCSSHLRLPIPCGVAFIGEIGLSGELRAVPGIDARLNTVAKLGYKKCIVPMLSLKSLKGQDPKERELLGCANLKEVIKGQDHKEMQIIGCANLKEVINTVLKSGKKQP